jgi:phage major head subunit gpT-like protein
MGITTLATGPYAFEGVDASQLEEVHVTFTGFLFKALGISPRWTQGLQIANELLTRGNSAKIKMASLAYGVHEWLDERIKSKIAHSDHEIEVKRWANALNLKLDDLEDEDMNLAQYMLLIQDMGDDFVEHRHRLYIDLIANGFDGTLGLAYDGQFFFDSDHPLPDGTTQSNVNTAAFSAAALYTGIAAMEAMKKPNGVHANVSPTHLIAPSALREEVEAVLDLEIVPSTAGTASQSNPHKKRSIKPQIDPRLDAYSTTAWFLWDASKPLKPFLAANRKAVTPQMDRTKEFEEGSVSWGAYARYNASYGFYQTMWASTGAG